MKNDKQNPVMIVKQKLWRFGYKVKDVTELSQVGFDLLVEGKFEVMVMFGSKPTQMYTNSNVIAHVDGLKSVTFHWEDPKGKMVESKSPYKIFGKKNK